MSVSFDSSTPSIEATMITSADKLPHTPLTPFQMLPQQEDVGMHPHWRDGHHSAAPGPFDASVALIRKIESLLSHQGFALEQLTSLMQPALRALADIAKKASVMRQERDNSNKINALKGAIFKSCARLGAAPTAVFDEIATMRFDEKVTRLEAEIVTLQVLETARRTTVGELVARINALKTEMEEPIVPLGMKAMRYSFVGGGSAAPSAAVNGRAAFQGGGGSTSGASPPSSVATASSLVGTTAPTTMLHGTLPPTVHAGGGMSSVEDVARADFYASLSENTAAEVYDEDLSEAGLQSLRQMILDMGRKREVRLRIVRQVALDIMQLWKEDAQVPQLSDKTLCDLDRKILVFAKQGYEGAASLFGTSASVEDALIQRKQTIVVVQQDRISSTLEINRRLKLIEDRIALLAMMRRFEAQASNPLRLFGDSRRLMAEDRFRQQAYPRLLLIEATIRAALVLYQQRHNRPFMYRNGNFLELLDNDLRTRKIPRTVFPLSHDPGLFAEVEFDSWFGSQGRMDGNYYKGVSDELAKFMEETQPDFARVLAMSTQVTDVLAERVLTQTADALNWFKGELMSGDEKAVRSDEEKLLALGWQLPTVHPDVATRREAIGQQGSVVAQQPDLLLHQKYWTKQQREKARSPPRTVGGGIGGPTKYTVSRPPSTKAPGSRKPRPSAFFGASLSQRSDDAGGTMDPTMSSSSPLPVEDRLNIVNRVSDIGGSTTMMGSSNFLSQYLDDRPKLDHSAVPAFRRATASPVRGERGGSSPLATKAAAAAGPIADEPKAAAVSLSASNSEARALSRRAAKAATQAMAPVPPVADVRSEPCRATHYHGATCPGRCGLATGNDSSHHDDEEAAAPCLPTTDDVYGEVPPRLLPEAVLVPALPSGELIKHIRLTEAQLRNIRSPKHVPFSKTDAAVKEVDSWEIKPGTGRRQREEEAKEAFQRARAQQRRQASATSVGSGKDGKKHRGGGKEKSTARKAGADAASLPALPNDTSIGRLT